jgi:hypothetical protein
MSQFEDKPFPSVMVSEVPNDPERAKGSKGESNHPENVSSAMLLQGVLFENRCATVLAHA